MYSSAYVWAKILSNLEERLGAVTISAWLDDAEVVELNETNLILYSPSDFRREIIRRRCTDLIQDALKEIFNSDAKLLVFGDEELNARKAKGKNPTAMDFNPQFTFDNFVVGNSNRFAKAAAMAVANNPAFAYNPFFLFSDSGLGKTHLMNAIGNQIRKNHPDMKILYISSETFTNELIESVEHNRLEAFREKYRSIDVLLIDDIQFLRNRESTQEEFFHTFNTLEKANKQIIISSDRPPKELDTLEERLTSRFMQGLIIEINHPDFETRSAILRSMAEKDHLEFPLEVIQLIATNVKTNIRELEGAYTKVSAYASLTKQQVTMELARKALKDLDMGSAVDKVITVEAIQELVASRYKIRVEDLKAKKRTRSIAYPRQIAMYLTRELTDLSLPRIGECFGGRDHTTVLHACDKISEDKKNDANLERQLAKLVEDLKK